MNTTELFTAMNILGAGTKSSARAVSAYNAIVNELADPRKQERLWDMGIEVREGGIGDFRNLADILKEIAETDGGTGTFDTLSTVFSGAAMDAIFAYNQFGNLADGLEDLGDTSGEIEKKAESNAKSITSNLQNLQTAFMGLADKNLTGPLEEITKFLNKLAEDPERVERYIRNITIGIGALGLVKIGAGVASFIANLKGIRGGKIDIAGLSNAGGGAGIPVHVTNWGGSAGTGADGNMTSPGLLDQYGNPLASTRNPSTLSPPVSNPARSGVVDKALNYAAPAAVTAGLVVAGAKMNEIYSNKSPEGLAHKMVLEDAMSRMMYEGYDPSAYIASHPEALTMEKALGLMQNEISAVPQIPPGGGNPVLEGNAQLENHVYIHQDRVAVESFVRSNTTPIEVETGRAVVPRENAL
jgi:hypothetical protein